MNRTVVDYQVVGGKDPADLLSLVKPLIAEGWQPWGSMCANTAPNDYGSYEEYLWQAMVKYAA